MSSTLLSKYCHGHLIIASHHVEFSFICFPNFTSLSTEVVTTDKLFHTPCPLIIQWKAVFLTLINMPLIYYEACMLDFSEIEQNVRHRNAEKQQSAEARRRVSRARHGQREVVVHHAVTQVGGAVVETRVLTQVLLTFDTHIV